MNRLLLALVVVVVLVAGCSGGGAKRPLSSASGRLHTPSTESQRSVTRRPTKPSRLIGPAHNAYGIYYRAVGLGSCHGPDYRQPLVNFEYTDYGAQPQRPPIVLSFRDVSDALPEKITPLKIVVISPTGVSYSAVMAVPRGVKSLHNFGQEITFPGDFYTKDANEPSMQQGVYTALLFSASGALDWCGGFVSSHQS